MPSLDDLKKESKVLIYSKITKATKWLQQLNLEKLKKRRVVLIVKNAENILNLTKSINDIENAPKLLVGTGQDKTYLCVVLTADRGLWWF